MNVNESEALIILQEECLEVGHLVCKIERFGIDDYNPDHKLTNRKALALEMGHVYCMLDFVVNKYNMVDILEVSAGIYHKLGKLDRYSSLTENDSLLKQYSDTVPEITRLKVKLKQIREVSEPFTDLNTQMRIAGKSDDEVICHYNGFTITLADLRNLLSAIWE